MPILAKDLPSSRGKNAPPPAAQKITAWSFSRLNDYRKCPKYAFFKHVQKLKEPESKALERGSSIHTKAQVFANESARKKCPEELRTFEAEFRVLQRNRKTLATEQKWCFTKAWKKTGWFDDDAWCRIVVDACYVDAERGVLVVIDHKTGKINPDHLGQLELYALGGLLHYPDVTGVEVQLWYLDHGVQAPEQPKVYDRTELPKLKKVWESNTKAMMADGSFREKPGKACTWCAFSRSSDGPCKF